MLLVFRRKRTAPFLFLLSPGIVSDSTSSKESERQRQMVRIITTVMLTVLLVGCRLAPNPRNVKITNENRDTS